MIVHLDILASGDFGSVCFRLSPLVSRSSVKFFLQLPRRYHGSIKTIFSQTSCSDRAICRISALSELGLDQTRVEIRR